MFTLKLRRDDSRRWEIENPILDEGEPGFEKDTGRFKIGNGLNNWMDLSYFIPEYSTDTVGEMILDHINSPLPHPVYDDGPSFVLLYENAKV